MPTILRIGPYRFFFFSNEDGEPIHIHVIREKTEAKFWIEPEVSVACNEGFSQHELNKIMKMIIEHKETIKDAWNTYKN
jgi:hypothetical protein